MAEESSRALSTGRTPDNGRPIAEATIGALLGTAYGDALGLPYEGLSRRRAARMLGTPDRYRFLFGRGMISDDTEHAVMVAHALLASKRRPDKFASSLGNQLRLWILALPGGIGLATLRAVGKLLLGFPPGKSGVFSAGNGPAMRAPLLGAVARDLDELKVLVERSTIVTHTDPKALDGAMAIALAAYLGKEGALVEPGAYRDALLALLSPESELGALVQGAVESSLAGESTDAYAESLGLGKGVSGYVLHTVPVCIHAWLSHQGALDAAVRTVIQCGGDADTTAAIVGGVVGAQAGEGRIDKALLAGLLDWPWREPTLAALGRAVAAMDEDSPATRAPSARWLLRFPRNVLFITVVLFHGFRRLFPPY